MNVQGWGIFHGPMQHELELTIPYVFRFYVPEWLRAAFLPNGATLRYCSYLSLEGVLILDLVILTLSNPILLPPAYSPALVYFGWERGWWITCNYPTVLKEKNINMNSPDDYIIYFRLHKIIKVFLFIFVYNLFECDTS
jgi:hypothetical protein